MIKKLLLTIAAVLCATALFAQKSEWGGVKGTVVNRAGRAPIAGAVILDEFIPAGRAKKITGRGKLYIREEVLKGSKIKYPSKESFDNAGNAALIPLGAKPRQMSGTTSTAWLIDPDL